MFNEDANGTPAEPSAATPVSGDEPMQLAQAPGEPIGAIEELTGSVTLTRADGSSAGAQPGDPVFLDDVVSTATGSSVEIRFVDGTRFSLGQDGEMLLDQLVYNPAGGGNELDLSVVQGAFTFVTGAIAGAPGEGMEVRVPVGTIGIRGTAVGGGPDTATADPTDYTVVLLPEEGGRVGRIVLTDVNGRSVILDAALEAMDLTSLGMPPGEPVVLTREQVIDLLGSSVENIEDILDEILNFEPQEDENPEAGEQRGDAVPTTPNTGGINQQRGETQSLDELTTLFTLSDEQGFRDRDTGPLGGFTPNGGLGDSDTPAGPTDGGDGGDQPLDTPEEEEAPTRVVITGGAGDDNLDASDVGPAEIIGLAGNDTLIGSSGDDILIGGDGDDVLDAGAGNDQVFGEGGNDLIIGGSGEGDDQLDGGAGIDTVQYSSATQPVNVNLTAGTASGGPAIGNDTLANIENVIGGQGNDTIIGDAADNTLAGGAGNDLLGGQAGDDTLEGGAGNDTLLGGSGDDQLDGGEGGDTLSGDAGDDSLTGGAGFDTAVFSGNRDDYEINGAEGGGFIVTDLRDGANDGSDFVAADVEVLQFADGAIATAPDAVDDTKLVSPGPATDRVAKNGAAMRTSIEVTAGAVLTLRVNFLDSEPDTDEGTFKDFAAIVIGDQVIKLADVDQAELPFAVGGFDEQTGYWTYSFTFSESGTYTLGLVVMNEYDERYDPGLLVDGISVSDGSFAEEFESGLDGWHISGNVDTVGTYGGVAPPTGGQQALLLVDSELGQQAAELEEFLGLTPGALSEVVNQPSVSGNVLGNDGAGLSSVASVAYAGDTGDVADPNGSRSGDIVTFIAADGSWELRFDLATGGYSFTVLGPVDYGDGQTLSLPFEYVVEGLSGATDSATLTIVIDEGFAGNSPPIAADDWGDGYGYAMKKGEVFTTNAELLLDNDSDPDGDTLFLTAVGNAIGGTVSLGSKGVITFIPDPDCTGPASFDYTVSDNKGGADTATVHINVTASSGATEGNDYLVGTPLDDEIHALGGSDEVYGLEGDDKLYGDAGDDSLFGGAGTDVLDGGEGADTLVGTAGEDTFIGGDGDDMIVIDDLIPDVSGSVDGGEGIDTLLFTGADEIIDLSQLGSIESIERIDIGGSGDNEIRLSADDIIRVSDDSEGVEVRTMTIFGNEGDRVVHRGSWDEQGPEDVGGTSFNVYLGEGAKLYVEEGITVTD